MVFSSPIFLFLFLPIVLLAVGVVRRELRNSVLLVASLIFYAWGEGELVILMLLSITMNFIFGMWVGAAGTDKSARRALAVSVVFNLGLLGAYKYANFAVDQVNWALGMIGAEPIELAPVHLPIGISFFTFQAMSYVIDVYRKETVPQRNIVNLALYISLFPQLIAGPIVRYHDVAKQLVHRVMSVDRFASGVQRFVMGLAKKVLIANTMAVAADGIFAIPAGELTAPLAWLGIVSYTLQIYFDFSGYSDMAIGLGRMFGFEFLENFNYPYISRSIREFWRRWHISLSTWFRDYLYIPLGGNRVSSGRVYVNLVIVFFLTGLWHGASWSFVIWGLFHGFFLVIERLGFERIIRRLWAPVGHAYAMLVFVVGWVFFRADDLPYAFSYLKAMFGMSAGSELYFTEMYMDKKFNIALAMGLILCAPAFPYLRDRLAELSRRSGMSALGAGLDAVSFVGILTLLLLSSMSLASSTYNPFIYFRF